MSEQAPRELYDCRDAFAGTLEALAELDDRVVVVVNDSVGSSKLAAFKTRFPTRLIDVGIAEGDMVGVAAGLANGGRIPFVSAASCFLTARALEQIKVDVAYSMANVKLCGMSPGVAYGELGPTHHSIEDIAWLRAIAELPIIVPADPLETEGAIREAAAHQGPVFIRVSRTPVPAVYRPDYCFAIGPAVKLREGRDVTIVANGILLSRALDTADLLAAADQISARVLAIPTVKPLDVEAIIEAARETGGIVTLEEHTVYGGLGGAVAETVVSECPVPMRIIGIPGVFAPTGSASWLLDHFGLTVDNVRKAALELVRLKSGA
ncbi:MAG: transketolase C-terminal domain-containing protein [Gaiellaceae bacterium]|jgi:transketolase